ncbi:MAG: hypothetical protein M3O30_13150 [Planctomycetota bacterium]|nr:hypothetical protein [Planctomycetota bacterium]
MMRQWWLGALVCFTLGSVLMARQGVIVTNDGRTLEGDIDDSGAATRPVTVTLHSVKTEIPRSSIVSIDYSATADQEFQGRLARLAPNDAAGRLALANWALEKQEYGLAKRAAEEAQKIEPHDPDVATTLETIKRQEVLNSEHDTGVTLKAAPTQPASNQATSTTQRSAAITARYLSDEDIQAIRRAELREDDDVRVQFYNDVRRRFMVGGGFPADQFFAMSSAAQAAPIIRSQDPKLIRDVKITSDPAALAEFRNRINLRLEIGCAAAGCHGGAKGGSFNLYPDARTTAAVYTNFYLLQAYKVKLDTNVGIGRGPAEYSMIDRLHPAASLLLQYGLPASEAITPHPLVKGWRPMFNGATDPFYAEVFSWIGSTLKPFDMDYGINFQPAGAQSQTQPATQNDTSAATAPAAQGDSMTPGASATTTAPATSSDSTPQGMPATQGAAPAAQ